MPLSLDKGELMKPLWNAKTLLLSPEVAWDYLNYQVSKLKNAGQAVRFFPNDIKVTNLSGFSEFHSCSQYLSWKERKFLQKYPIDKGDLIDVGANIGIVSMIMAKRFPESQIHAFEPNPSTFQALQNNIAINDLTNIQAEQYALAGYKGEISFTADSIHRATCSIATLVDQHTVFVPCTRLDSYLEKRSVKEIAFLKVDVEGYETLVFQGAENMLKRQQAKLIYYEVCPLLTQKAGFEPELPTRMLIKSGYQICKLNDRSCLIPVNLTNINQVNLENWIAIRS